MYSFIPCASHIIYILWIINSKQPYWWKASVLEIEQLRNVIYRSKETIIYETGPGVDIYSVFKVSVYSYMNIFEVQNSTRPFSLCNTWITYEEDSQTDDDEIDWTLSQKRISKMERYEENTATLKKKQSIPLTITKLLMRYKRWVTFGLGSKYYLTRSACRICCSYSEVGKRFSFIAIIFFATVTNISWRHKSYAKKICST